MHEGHRQRILERVEKGEHLEDHELLEIVLFNPIARKNTNEIAHALLDRFGSAENVLSASLGELASVKGVGKSTALYLHAVAELFTRMRAEDGEPPRVYNYRTFSEHLASRYDGMKEEVLDLFCLDAQFRITFTVRFGTHERDRVQVPLEEIDRAVAAHRPCGIVIAHNHPYGPALPSEEDRLFTERVETLCSLYNVRLYDHIVVSPEKTYSFFFNGDIGGETLQTLSEGSEKRIP